MPASDDHYVGGMNVMQVARLRRKADLEQAQKIITLTTQLDAAEVGIRHPPYMLSWGGGDDGYGTCAAARVCHCDSSILAKDGGRMSLTKTIIQ